MKYRISLIIVFFLAITGCKWTLGTDPTPTTFSVQTISQHAFGGNTHFLKIKDYTAFLLDSQNGVIEVDISDPSFIDIENNYFMDSFSMDVCSYGYVLANGNVNIIRENNFGQYEFWETLEYDNVQDCIVDSDMLYVADVNFGLRIIDITHDFFISEVGDYYTGVGAEKIVYQDEKIYLMHQGGIQIIDVSNSSYPVFDSEIYFEGILDFEVKSTSIYCMDEIMLKIYDLENNNIELSETIVDEYPTTLSVYNNLLLIGNSNYEIIIYDVSDKYNPEYEDSWYVDDEVKDLEIIENYVFIANSTDGFVIQKIDRN